MDVVGSVNDQTEDNDPEWEYINTRGTIYCILKCPACKKVNIASYFWHDAMESEEEYDYEFLYPQMSTYPLGLPENILSAFKAAEKVKAIDVNAYAILTRRLLEIVCLDKKAKPGNLAAMLSDLSSKNEIPGKLVKVATGLKDFGNIGAHAGSGDLTEKEIPILSALCIAIIEYVYSAPYLAMLAEQQLNNIKASRSNVDKKDTPK